jgi:medium-chain acyl-[acyl-carrier-protein] hydrolase
VTWVVRHGDPAAPMRLFCFPFAGGGASVFRGWRLPGVEVCAIQLPGRESRLHETPFDRLPALVDALAVATRPWRDRRFAFFGHSLGAIVAFELARALRRRGEPLPHHLVVSGCSAPHLVDAVREVPPMSSLPDRVLRERLRRFGGTPDAVLEHPELMELLLPVLRADLALRDGYACAAEAPLRVPVTAFGGRHDAEVPVADVAAWHVHTSAGFAARTFAGGHFFVRTAADEVVAAVAATLASTTEARRAG